MSQYCLYQRHIKRALDIFFSLALLVILLPLFLFLGLLILILMGSPILFKQLRPGFQEKPFTLLKFRTMNFQSDAIGVLSSDMQRITLLGKYLRRFSLDELPQLINIALGQMSFIGPRPLLLEYLPLYSNSQRRRHDVLPGITGWAQVQGRNQMGWDERFKCDLWYVDNISFVLDIKIIFLTLLKIITGSGVNAEDGVTMKKFTGGNS
jgi:sugar transferase EpsL